MARILIFAAAILALFSLAYLANWGWGVAAGSCMILGSELIIARRKHGTELRSRQIDQVRNRTLESLLSGAPLETVLEGIVTNVEAVEPNMLCSILRLKNGCLVEGVAPSLPDFYNEAIDGLAIGNGIGSCGEAAWSGKRVIATDVQTHPNWQPFLGVTERAGLRACWSEPILASTGQVLGTFAMYYREPRSPEPWELELISTVANIASLAIERKQLERERIDLKAQVLHGQKLESLGVLAGGIAHDFNNLLTVVIGHADLARSKISEASPVNANLDEVIKTSERAADLCRQLLAYSGRGRFVIEPIDLNAEIRSMEQMLAVTISENCTLNSELEEKLPLIEADATQIRQVMLNLITNASDALGDSGGSILVRSGTSNFETETEEPATGPDSNTGPAVLLEVSDDGCGMDAATRARLFEPFFSSKGPGRGLGLSAVHGIVKGHGGRMSVRSTIGAGTVIRALFPALESSNASETSRKTAQAGDSPPSGGVILVVDDNESIRAVAREMLTSMGYAVITAEDGLAALRELSGVSGDIRAVLLDLTMPRMGGEQAFRAMRRTHPDLPIVLCSGYNQETVDPSLMREPRVQFLKKPFQAADLEQVINEAIRSPAGNPNPLRG